MSGRRPFSRLRAEVGKRAALAVLISVALAPAAAMAAPVNTGASSESDTVRAWRAFSEQLEEAGVAVLQSYPQPQAIDRAEALPFLLQQLSTAITRAMIEQPGQPPLLRVDASTINKWALDGADVKYLIAPIDPARRYRLRGRVGEARLFAMQAVRMAAPYGAFASLTGDELTTGADNSFEVLLSASRPDDWHGAWLQIDPDADYLLLREYFADWESEEPGHYELHDLAVPQPGLMTLERAEGTLAQVLKTFEGRTTQWQPLVERIRDKRRNSVNLQRVPGKGLATNFYGTSWFDVPPGKALLIEWRPPQARLWSVQLANAWWESIDYLNHLASYNSDQAIADPDGVYRFVITHEDPGIANWLDPAGHNEGALLFRLQIADEARDPVVTLVDFADLDRHLPADAARATPQERARALAVRRAHAARRWAP